MQKESIIEWAERIGEAWPEAKEASDKLVALVKSGRAEISELIRLYVYLKKYDRPNGCY